MRPRRSSPVRLQLLALTALLVGVAPAPASAQSDFWFTDELQSYRLLVETYRLGQVREAIAGVLAFDPDVTRVHGLIDRVRPTDARLTGTDTAPDINELLFRAAAMLHLDVADRVWSRGLEEAASDWLEVAVRWTELGARAPEPAGSFRRRWYLGGTLLAFERGGWSDGVTFSEVALERVPDDVSLLTAAAWLHEGLALTPVSLDDGGASQLDRIQEAKRATLSTSARRAEAALALSPDASEAALRVARVSALLGRAESARDVLTRLVNRADLGIDHAYLARLLLGDLNIQAAEPDAAERRFREAVDLIPDGQAARMALARLLDTQGDRRGAARILQPAVGTASTRSRISAANPSTGQPRQVITGLPDPWVGYVMGAGDGPGLRQALRVEIRQ
jgi:tetratricopeptide (TPR) repeat protein